MKFRLKITLCMLGLLSVLFGIGGSLLITLSFQTSLEREQEAAYNAYQMVLGTLQIVNSVNGQLADVDIARILEQLTGQNTGSWTALRLYTSPAAQSIYEYNTHQLPYPTQLLQPGSSTMRYESTADGGHKLSLSGTHEVGNRIVYLDMARDISPLFEARRAQQKIYQWIFLLMVGLCALLSHSIARFLTAPLDTLSRASQSIAAGDLSSRVPIRSRDEISLVAREFNAMAKALEENISELKDAADRQERFIGSFAHEVKTPMTSIIGYGDLLRGQTLGEDEQLQAAGYIVTEGKRLVSLSQKLLDLLVLRQGEIVLTPGRPAALIQGLAAHLEPLYTKQSITITCDCEDGVCLMESDLVKSLLVNLWDNARKSMQGRGGCLCVRSEMLPDGCRITVRDTGRGIPSASLEHLTEAFYRADHSRARRQGGVGLGLSLCREIAKAHNGNIRFESQEGMGTTVIVELRGGTP